jgi:xanthine dehydrogenase large subunit
MYGIGAFFAIRDALRAFRPDREPVATAPLTPERILRFLYDVPEESSDG